MDAAEWRQLFILLRKLMRDSEFDDAAKVRWAKTMAAAANGMDALAWFVTLDWKSNFTSK